MTPVCLSLVCLVYSCHLMMQRGTGCRVLVEVCDAAVGVRCVAWCQVLSVMLCVRTGCSGWCQTYDVVSGVVCGVRYWMWCQL